MRPPKRAFPPGGKPQDPGELLERIARERTPGEKPIQTLLRRHEASINAAQREIRIIVDEGSERLRAKGIGTKRQGRVVPREKDIKQMDELFEALHNPRTGTVPARFADEFDELRRLTDWEEAARIDFDPAMATVDDYFYRGWKPPKDFVPTSEPGRGRVGLKPAFTKLRVNATY
ncbi:MAG: hypothetical protein J3T61_00875, partial [Candidatus Brocadiales bacterium]|nr:hypothetical protein [Candidatus Bathyanammoxibius sp.]